MHSGNHIRYLRRQEIDISKWDACMAAAPNSLIYGRSFYLDAMTDGQWDAMVLDDYQAVMPLTWRRRAGIRYLYQPAFTQQGGIFAPGDISPALFIAFLDQLGHHFRFAEIFLNYANPAPPFMEARTNFILPLDKPYQELAAQYKKDLVRNLQTAAGAELNYGKDADLQSVLDGYRREYADRLPHVKEEEYRRFEKLCFACRQKGQLLVRVVTNPQQQLLATALLLVDPAPPVPVAASAPSALVAASAQAVPSRMYLLQSTTTPAGREIAANHFLLDGLVKEWAGHPLILDFEGSEVPGIAHFYRNFGSRNQPYFYYRYNKLPWPLRLLKK